MSDGSHGQEKQKLPEEPPPQLASVVEIKGDVIVYRDYYSHGPIPKKGLVPPKALPPAYPSDGPLLAYAVEFSLKTGEVFDAEGKKVDAAAAKKRLEVGATVLISTSGKEVDPAYLRVFKKETLVLVHPDEPVKVEKEWKGGSRDEKDNDLSEQAPKDGVIAGPETWAKLWKAWNSDKELPKVDFGKELLIVEAGPGGTNIVDISDLKLRDDGDLTFFATVTQAGGSGFVYKIVKIKREGIKTVNGKDLPKE
jgi:hypothetical protein